MLGRTWRKRRSELTLRIERNLPVQKAARSFPRSRRSAFITSGVVRVRQTTKRAAAGE